MKEKHDVGERATLRARASRDFNDLPFETRSITLPSSLCTQITELEIMKSKIKTMVNKEIKEMNEKIEFLYREMDKLLVDSQ